jgi:putative transport protein
VAHAVLVLACIAAAGLAAGSVRVRGVSLGTAGVLFAGLAFGHAGVRIDAAVQAFVWEFGLILFVFTIGMQLGPGFFASMRRDGMRLNLMAAAVVVLGGAATVACAWALRIDWRAAAGLLPGATTNTPSLGAAQQALETLGPVAAERAALPALAYAVGYPVGIVGIIGTMILLRVLFRVDPAKEAAAFRAEQLRGVEPLVRMSLRVENPNLDGVPIGEVPGRRETGVVVSRVRSEGDEQVRTATERTVLRAGDVVLAVGTQANLTQFARVVGRRVEVDLLEAPGLVSARRIVVTRRSVVGKTFRELGLDHLYGVTVTRVTRADLEMTAIANLRIQFGDMLYAVGQEEGLAKAAQALGDSLKELNATHYVPVFLGIALGVLAGVLPLSIPGLPVPVRLGLAGGPLVLAIVLSRIGRIGPLLWYIPVNANLAIRELGITLFLSCVGLKAGERFFATVVSADGLRWLAGAAVIAVVPLLVVGVAARAVFRLNFVTIGGLLAGSMTDPPALAFACEASRCEGPAVSYATVYPLTMLLRILAAQVLALSFCG